jgi:hypothetical protein
MSLTLQCTWTLIVPFLAISGRMAFVRIVVPVGGYINHVMKFVL